MKGVTEGRQLGSPETIREKIEVKTVILVSSELAGERENVRKAESKITELVEKVESAEKQERAVRAEIRCDRIPHLEQQLLSTQQLLHTKEEELKALTTQYRATRDTLLHTQERFSTQQQVLSSLQYTAQQKEEQLQARVRENTALHTQGQALANQVVTLQSQIAQLEQTMQATQAALAQIPYLEQQLQSKEEQLQSLTEVTQIPVQPTTPSVCQAGVQTGAIGTLHPAELQSQHAELQQRMTVDSELLLQEIQETKEQLRTLQADKQEFEHLLQIRSIENQTLKVEVQEIGEQVEALHLEKSNLEEKLAKETFLETALGYEVDALREDVMDRQQVEFHHTSTQTVVDIPETSPTGEELFFFWHTKLYYYIYVLSTCIGSLRGAEVVAERNFIITNQARSYRWDEFGFRLHVPENSLEAGLRETTVNVRVSLSGHFQLPDDSELVSAVYWVFSPHVFSQPLTVDVQHCAAPSQNSNLSFVRTKCTQKELPYQFKELQRGSFSQQSFYGSISVNHFSGVAIKRKRSEEVSDDYCAKLYKSREGVHDCRFIFAITRNLEACFSVSLVNLDLTFIVSYDSVFIHVHPVQVVDQKYCTSQAQHYTSFTFGFEEKQISLNIPNDGIELDNGWEIFPLFWPPTVISYTYPTVLL